MLPEQQHRILGYFIEETKDHLNTIEQGLLNLQDTLLDPEMLNEVFRAVHSVKGGAAMLGLNSIQQTAHRLEDYFKILKECPTIQADQKLESLFLRVFDTFQELLEQLVGSFCLTEDVANNLMSDVEPVFEALNQHLALLVNQAESREEDKGTRGQGEKEESRPLSPPLLVPSSSVAPPTPLTPGADSALFTDFDDLFDTTEETEKSLDLIEATPYASSTQDADFSNFWEEALEDLETTDVPETAYSGLENWLEIETNSDFEAPSLNPTEEMADEVATVSLASKSESGTDTQAGAQTTQNTRVEAGSPAVDLDGLDDFGELDELLGEEPASSEFSELEALLDDDTSAVVPVTQTVEDLTNIEPPSTAPDLSVAVSTEAVSDEFGDLEKLLEEGDKTEDEIRARDLIGSPTVKPNSQQGAAINPRRQGFEQTMRVPVKNLDNINNLVGELVVNRNSLEQDQQRLRQFLDNLLYQVQQLSDVGSRMQELYERSLLEASLLTGSVGFQSASPSDEAASPERHTTGMDFDALELDRFTSFHTLSQEMIELIVRVRESSSDIEFVTDETEQVARQFRQVTTHLQEGLTRSRMVPFAQIAERLPRAVRDIALKYGKQAELHIEGRETLIDKVILEQLYDPMTHLVNNSITHGIETPEERSAKSKSPVGKVTIRAFHQGNQTVISVTDDGSGIDSDRVMTKAIQKGLITVAEAKTMSTLDVYNLLFHPGFSTKDQVDEFAGRGVGMDVVQTSLSEIQGTINTDSTLGKGTTFTIRLPLSLSICKALCCLSDKARIAFPMDGVEDMMDLPASDVLISASGQSCISWRNSLLPFRPLKELLTYNRQLGRGNVYGGNREDDMISIVVLRSPGTFIALQVDQVLGEQEIVIKQFEGPAPKPVGVAGATVMGDGRIMPIADVLELIDISMGRLQREGGGTLWATSAAPVLPETSVSSKTETTVLIVDDSITVRELLSLTFNKAGYRVEQARDGQEAWEKLRDGLPCDIVFCDIEMPRMDGLELLSRMQTDPSFSHLPIAMLTSRGADRHRQMAVQLGASGYFTKPYLEEALLDAAQRMLRGEVLVTTNSNA